MSSAAKLRNRGIAIAGATALVMTSFGPAAFAWTAPTNNTANQAGVASVGLIDTAPSKTDTQGATVVAPGGVGQAIGDVRFVVPSTFAKGDHIDFALTDGNEADADSRISFSAKPAVEIGSTAYAATTHVGDTSKSTGNAAGATEGGALTEWKAGTGSIARAVAPDYTTTLETVRATGKTGAFQNVLRVTFNNDSDASDAKFIGTIKGAKVDVGKSVAVGDLGLTAEAYTGAGTTSNNVDKFFMGDTADEERNVTYPATIATVSMAVAGGSVVSDGTYQFVGPVTVSNAGTFSTSPVGFKVAGGTFDPNAKVTATQYAATDGKASDLTVSFDAATQTYTATPTAGGNKVVFSGMALRASGNSGEITYTLVGQGASASGYLGAGAAATRHQVDIEKPQSQVASNTTATPLPDRIGGQDRYQTAVKIAERALGTDEDGPMGESDNVVIASGEGYADALSAGYLAATKKAQLILTRAGSLPQTDVEFLKTYGAKNVYIVGGNGSVSKAVEDQLRSMQSYDVQSATTSTSTKTSYTANFGAPSKTGFSLSSSSVSGLPTSVTPGDVTITLTRVAGVPTAASFGGANAGDWGWASGSDNTTTSASLTFRGQPVKLTTPAATTTGTAAENVVSVPTTTTTQQTVTPGDAGDASLAQGADRKVVPLDAKLTVLRIAGNDRFETNRKVNEYAGATSVNPVGVTIPEYGKPAKKTALVTNGMGPWDALAAGPLVGNAAGRNPIPLVLTAGSKLNANAKAQMQSLDIEAAIFVGGTGVLPDSLMGEADNLGAYTTRLAGADRWGTAKAIADFAVASSTPSTTNKMPGLGFAKNQPILANGGSMNGSTSTAQAQGAWADALAAGPYSAADKRVIALTDSRSLPGTTKDMLQANSASFYIPVLAVGLGDVISTETVAAANAAIANK